MGRSSLGIESTVRVWRQQHKHLLVSLLMTKCMLDDRTKHIEILMDLTCSIDTLQEGGKGDELFRTGLMIIEVICSSMN